VLAGAGVLFTALLLVPHVASRAFWFAIVPALPALFLVNAEAWRNVCPVATLSTLGDRDAPVRPLTRDAARRWTSFGVLLFFLLVPLRIVVLEADGIATAALLAAAAVGAVAGGLLLDRKAGFCNSVCPILPVERLYGQRPLTRVANARCVPCRACTQHACFDLNPERSGLVSLGSAAGGPRWIFTPFGAFALALPGFVVAFAIASSTITDVSGAPALARVYGTVLLGAALSWATFATALVTASIRPARALATAAAAAVGVYYWVTPAAIVDAWALNPIWLPVMRAATLLLVGVWSWRALVEPRKIPLAPVRLEP
jgi:hypothetical protein